MRQRHALVAAFVFVLLALTMPLHARAGEGSPVELGTVGADSEDRVSEGPRAETGKQSPIVVTRHDIMARLDGPEDKAASLLARAESLIRDGRSDEAVRILNRIVSMELPAGREADKVVAAALLALGDVYNGPDMYADKAASFYERAIAFMDRDLDLVQIVDTLETIGGIRNSLGDHAQAERVENMSLDVQFGFPVEIGFEGFSSTAAPLDQGDDTCETAVPVVLPDQELMSIDPAFDQNWRRFTLVEPRLVVLETIDNDVLKDTKLELYQGCPATASDPIYEDDDGGEGLLSRIETNCLAPGEYWVKVFAYQDRTPQGFTLSITDGACPAPVPVDEYEPDDEIGLATRIGFRNNGVGEGNQYGRDNKRIQRHSFAPAPDVDWITFSLSRPNWVNIETFGIDGEDPDTLMGAVNSGGLLFAVSDDKAPGVGTSRMGFCLPRGDWFVPVLPYDPGDEFQYDVLVDVEYPCLFEEEPNGYCAFATPMTTDETWYALHEPSGLTFEDDWWTFTIDERSLVTIETGAFDSFISDTYLELYGDCGGPLLAVDDDQGIGLLSKIEAILDPGTYHVKATLSPLALFVGEMWDYSITVTLAGVPPTETEPNDSCAEANPTIVGDALLASIGTPGDRDYYLLTVPADAYVEIQTDGPVGDTVLDISSMDGSVQIGCDDDSGNGTFSWWGCCLPAGDYCVGVKAYGDNVTVPIYSIEFRELGVCLPNDPLQCSISLSPQCNPF